MKDRIFSRLFLLFPASIILYLVWKIFQPFLLPVSLAVVLSTLFFPLYRKILRKFGGRKNLASSVTCILIILAGIIPCLLLVVLLAQEVTQTYETVQVKISSGDFKRLFDQELNPFLQSVLEWIRGYVDLKDFSLLTGMTSLLQQASVFLIQHSTAIVSGFMGIFVDLTLMLFTMFFLFRDGLLILKNIDSLIPLSRRQELLVATPERFRDWFNVEVRVRQEVRRIDRAARTVEVQNLVFAQQRFGHIFIPHIRLKANRRRLQELGKGAQSHDHGPGVYRSRSWKYQRDQCAFRVVGAC